MWLSIDTGLIMVLSRKLVTNCYLTRQLHHNGECVSICLDLWL